MTVTTNGRSLFGAMLLMSGLACADVVSDWNAIMLNASNTTSGPLLDERVAAITQLAVFEAVNSVSGEFKSYLGTVPASPGASPEAAAVAAAHTTLIGFFPDRAEMLNASRAESLASIPDSPAKTAGIAAGEAAAAAVKAARANDGVDPPESYQPPPSTQPGQWQKTGTCAGGVLFQMRQAKPFSIRSAEQFRADQPPVLASGRYARAYEEVHRLGNKSTPDRPQDRDDVARFYAAVLATDTWNPVASQLAAAAQNKSLTQNARAFALLNMAIFDALIAVFESKYHYTYWRPETAIRAGETDDNPQTDPDPGFQPFITTPCHPSYPSAHAALGGAARDVLERIYGRRGHSITLSSPTVPGVTLRYESLRDISEDIDDARIYGGIHFRFDQAAGQEQGRRVGNYVFRNTLRRANSTGCPEDEDQ
jgi:hypothetical protein